MKHRCPICGAVILEKIGWTFWEVNVNRCCQTCRNAFEPIKSPCCERCSKPAISGVCKDCESWRTSDRAYLQKNYSLYHYNEFAKEVTTQFKFRGDYEIARVFSRPLQKQLEQLSVEEIIAIPLHTDRLKERGFNQTEALLQVIAQPCRNWLQRKEQGKQSKKSRKERLRMEQIFSLTTDADVNGKTILLVDDVYTTGATLHCAAELLHEHGAKQIEAITIFR